MGNDALSRDWHLTTKFRLTWMFESRGAEIRRLQAALHRPIFFRVMPNSCGSSVFNFLRFSFLTHRILRWLVYLKKIRHPWCRNCNSIEFAESGIQGLRICWNEIPDNAQISMVVSIVKISAWIVYKDFVINPVRPKLNPSAQSCLTKFLLGILLLEPCISLICAWKTNKYTNYSFSLLIMYGSSYMFRHYIAILRERS
jgi:hypothetical protein